MKMKLYCSSTSPYARKVRVVAHELGLSNLIEEVPTDPYNAADTYLSINPLSKVPTLVTDTGQVLPDSTLIVEYLQTRGRGLTSLPRGAARWAILRRQWLAEGIIDLAVSCQLEKRRPAELQSSTLSERHLASVLRALDALEAEAGELLSTETVRTVEVTVGVALGYLDLRQPQLQWRKGRERLAHWYLSFALRPSMQSTQPPSS
ncbi:MAG: glutathione S-transferase family protein [Nevskia sp.]|nr:glutathione S-transferase family protein [Nevskia sp.]